MRIGAILALACAVLLGANEASALEFTFTGQCDDCAFVGDPGVNDPLDDGLFQTVTGTLVLENVAPGPVIDVDSENFVSFSYGGSSLINPFVFTDPFIITGMLDASGAVLAGETLRIETSAGDFSNFCTPVGELVLEDGDFCSDFGIATFSLDSAGAWSVAGTENFDVGVGGGLATVPEPSLATPVVAGLLAFAAVRRRRVAEELR